jgi:pyridoxine 5-phosphate synthase
VPDPPDVLTSNAGWDTTKIESFLEDVIERLQDSGIRTSIFMETGAEMIEAAKKTGTNRIELYTEPYAANYGKDRKKAIAPFVAAAKLANQIGLELNAGHDLSLENLQYFHENIPGLLEVSIGHALVCDALYLGLRETVRRYQACLGKEIARK